MFLRALRRKLGAETEYLVTRDFLSGREDKELLLIRFLHLAFALGPGTVKRAGHPDVAPLYEMKKSLDWEVDKFQGFVRFEEHDGMLGAVIHPKNYILPLLRGHFCGRFPEENFMIYDAVHQAVLLYQDHKPQLLELAEPLVLPPPSAREQQFQALWKQFYKTLEIKARHNEARPHDPLPQTLLGRYDRAAGGIVTGTGFVNKRLQQDAKGRIKMNQPSVKEKPKRWKLVLLGLRMILLAGMTVANIQRGPTSRDLSVW